MAARKRDNEAHYKKIIREQKKALQRLTKKVGRGEKLEKTYFDVQQEISDLFQEEDCPEPVVDLTKCPKCGGKLNIADLGIRKLITCNGCPHREVSKK